MPPESFRCFHVRKTGNGTIESSVESRPLHELPPGEVLIRVQASSLNYKDALAATGNPGVARNFPHVPGIDSAGIVETSDSGKFKPGDQVLCTGYEQGAGQWGGWAEYVRLPADWVVPLPDGFTLDETMILGTAGFTAAQSVLSLVEHHIEPDRGPIVVTGATGGVGVISLMILSKLGYDVTAVSGKPDQYDWLKSLGASNVIGREEVDDTSTKPLLKARWAGAVDTVGGNTLATIIRSLDHRGVAAACGLVGGTDLPLTVFPFILRGVKLDGIDSAHCPYDRRLQIWNLLAGDWKLDNLHDLATEIKIDEVDVTVDQMMQGKTHGRHIVRPR
ncbi:MAG: YhdH/YhfP family quinone oxidoreductase [Planctomycetaceae bacterium]|nr:YhdH/YhfP family quinone oxidoreductase [Planctomycetaceae bacterium]